MFPPRVFQSASQDVLLLTAYDLMHILDIDGAAAQRIVLAVSGAVAPAAKPVRPQLTRTLVATQAV